MLAGCSHDISYTVLVFPLLTLNKYIPGESLFFATGRPFQQVILITGPGIKLYLLLVQHISRYCFSLYPMKLSENLGII